MIVAAATAVATVVQRITDSPTIIRHHKINAKKETQNRISTRDCQSINVNGRVSHEIVYELHNMVTIASQAKYHRNPDAQRKTTINIIWLRIRRTQDNRAVCNVIEPINNKLLATRSIFFGRQYLAAATRSSNQYQLIC